MNNYRASYLTFDQAANYAALIRLSGAMNVKISETSDGWDVTWKQP